MKKLNVFIYQNKNVDINSISRIKQNVLIISNNPISLENKNIKIIICPKKFSFNDTMVLALTYIKNNGYNFASFYINQNYIDHTKIVDNMNKNNIDFSMVYQKENNNKLQDIIAYCYIYLFTGKQVDGMSDSVMLMNEKALNALTDGCNFTNKAVTVKKILDYDLKYKKIIK